MTICVCDLGAASALQCAQCALLLQHPLLRAAILRMYFLHWPNLSTTGISLHHVILDQISSSIKHETHAHQKHYRFV